MVEHSSSCSCCIGGVEMKFNKVKKEKVKKMNDVKPEVVKTVTYWTTSKKVIGIVFALAFAAGVYVYLNGVPGM